jgi:hypothetical protein
MPSQRLKAGKQAPEKARRLAFLPGKNTPASTAPRQKQGSQHKPSRYNLKRKRNYVMLNYMFLLRPIVTLENFLRFFISRRK